MTFVISAFQMYILHFGHFFRKPEKLGSHTGSKWWPGDPDVKDDPNDPLIDPVTQWPSSMSGPYSIAERGVPELIPVLGSQPAGDVGHKPGSRLPLLSGRPAVTLATLKRAAAKNVHCYKLDFLSSLPVLTTFMLHANVPLTETTIPMTSTSFWLCVTFEKKVDWSLMSIFYGVGLRFEKKRFSTRVYVCDRNLYTIKHIHLSDLTLSTQKCN